MLAARSADEARLKIGQPELVGLSILIASEWLQRWSAQ
jgi:hypothetical protein